MSEEEKEVIKNIKLELEMTGDMSRLIFNRNNIETILKLIEKQQKRNEEQFEVICHYEDTLEHYEYKVFNGDLINLEKVKELDEIGILGKKYISKDKIKEKIEEITSYAYTSAAERDCQDYAIQVLKELLGE